MRHVSSVIVRPTAPEDRVTSALSITVHGRGGHGSTPHVTIDPVVILARLIVRFQALVAREVAPEDQVTLVIAAVDAGATHNVIPDDARVVLSVGAADSDRLRRVVERLRTVVNAECLSSGCETVPDFAQVAEDVTGGAIA